MKKESCGWLSRMMGVGAVCLFAATLSAAGASPDLGLVSAQGITNVVNLAANGESSAPLFSGNGRYVAFMSSASDLVTNQLSRSPVGNYVNVYLTDRVLGQTRLISVASDGVTGANGNSALMGVSFDGTKILMESYASDMVPGDVNGSSDVFVRDWAKGVTYLISTNTAGTGSGNCISSESSMSRDGRFVVFRSCATDLINDYSNRYSDIFIRDLETGVTRLVSVNLAGTGGGNGDSSSPLVSDDGVKVAFLSAATTLVTNDPNNLVDLFVRDMSTGVTIPLTRSVGTPDHFDGEFALSANGKAVTFRMNLKTSPLTSPLYWRDLTQETNVTVSLIPTNALPTNIILHGLDISEDGRYVIYDTDGQVFRWDSTTGATEAVGPAFVTQAVATTYQMTPDGRRILFASKDTNSVPGELGDLLIWHARDMDTKQSWQLNTEVNGVLNLWREYGPPAISADGNSVGFESILPMTQMGDYNSGYDVFARDLEAGTNAMISQSIRPQNLVGANGNSYLSGSSISADGRFIVYYSGATDLVANDSNGASDIFLFDTVTHKNQLISKGVDGASANGPSLNPVISADGKFVLFISLASNLTTDDTNTWDDIFLCDLNTKTIVRAPIPGQTTAPSTGFSQWAVNQNGSRAAFVFNRTCYVWDTISETVTPITAGGPAPSIMAISPDGSKVAYGSTSPLLLWDADNGESRALPPQISTGFTENPAFNQDGNFLFFQARTGDTRQIYRYSLASQTSTSLVTVAPDLFPQTAIDVSANGRWLVFTSSTNGLVAADTNGLADVFLLDADTGRIDLISALPDGSATSYGASDSPRISADGKYVTFRSEARDLVAGLHTTEAGIFLRDTGAGKTTLLSRSLDGIGVGDSRSVRPFISRNGQTIAFQSFSGDLVEGDFNGKADIFFASLNETTTGDADGDGMPDAWEQQFFGDLSRNGEEDFDGDGYSDLAEFLAGTDPTRADSALRCSLVILSPGDLRLEWSSVSGKTYRVQSRTDLGGGSWQNTSPDVSAQGVSTSFAIAPEAGVSARYYRVVLVQ